MDPPVRSVVIVGAVERADEVLIIVAGEVGVGDFNKDDNRGEVPVVVWFAVAEAFDTFGFVVPIISSTSMSTAVVSVDDFVEPEDEVLLCALVVVRQFLCNSCFLNSLSRI